MKKALTLTIIGGILTTLSSEAQIIHVAGSTAFRANMFRAIGAAFDGQAPLSVNPANASTGTGTVTFTGTISNLFGTNIITVAAFYDGSVRGLADLQFGNNLGYLGTSGTNTVPAPADLTLSDVDKSSTLFPNAPTVETPVAVLPFGLFRNFYSTNVTAMTDKQYFSLLSSGNGYLAKSFVTGLSSDDTNRLYVTGRNLDSGTRVLSDLDTGSSATTPAWWGFNTTAPTNWAQMNQNLSTAPSGFPNNFYGIGFASGGNEATALTNQNAGGSCIGFLGLNDGLVVATSGSTGFATGKAPLNPGGSCGLVSYNGYYPFNGYSNNIPANPDYTPVITGQYSAWSYEQMEIKNTHTNDNVYIYATNLIAALDADILAAKNASGNSVLYGPVTAIRLSDMKVTRTSVGGAITPTANP
jgi:hypothetical protein